MIAVIIPAYEPDERMISLLKELSEKQIGPVYLVNDGSGAAFDPVFEEARNYLEKGQNGHILTHEVNRGKGRALKTAFEYVLEHEENLTGVVTADSDGQHTVESIKRIMEKMEDEPKALILGVRNFSEEDIPWKSRLGNNMTEKVFTYVSGVHVTDTQTGLRGIPAGFCRELLEVKGERFEFEMRMLLETSGRWPIVEIPIETIYDSKENHQTHFRPIKDSVKIYRILGDRFLRFIFSSFSSSILDLLLFSLFCMLFQNKYPTIYAGIATVTARCLSALYNYLINYKLVFKSRKNVVKASIRYAILAVIQMSCSAFAIVLALKIFPNGAKIVFKIIIDTILFLLSFKIQQKFIF